MKELATLQEVINYQNASVIKRFVSQHNLDEAEVEDIFQETKKWLWLSAVSIHERREGLNAPLLFIDTPLTIIDEMWHNFILFTQDYMDFCERFFGFFIHHQPAIGSEESGEDDLSITQRQYSYIWDKLGEETLVKWYSKYSERYPRTVISEIRK